MSETIETINRMIANPQVIDPLYRKLIADSAVAYRIEKMGTNLGWDDERIAMVVAVAMHRLCEESLKTANVFPISIITPT